MKYNSLRLRRKDNQEPGQNQIKQKRKVQKEPRKDESNVERRHG